MITDFGGGVYRGEGSPLCWTGRLPSHKVNVGKMRNLEGELRIAVSVSDCKISGVDNVHTDEDVGAAEASSDNPYISRCYLVGQTNVNQIELGLIRTLVDPRMFRPCHANLLQSALFHYLHCYCAYRRACVPLRQEAAKLTLGTV